MHSNPHTTMQQLPCDPHTAPNTEGQYSDRAGGHMHHMEPANIQDMHKHNSSGGFEQDSTFQEHQHLSNMALPEHGCTTSMQPQEQDMAACTHISPHTEPVSTEPVSEVEHTPPAYPCQAAPPLLHTATPNSQAGHAADQWMFTNDPAHVPSQSAFTNHMVIPPPERKDPVEQQRVSYVVVDSSSRNHSDYPDPSDYTIRLPSEIRDVKQLQLVSYKVPRNQHPLRSTNTTLHFSTRLDVSSGDRDQPVFDVHSCSPQHITVPEGTYDDTLFAPPGTANPADAVEVYRNEIASALGADMWMDQLACEVENRLNSTAAPTFVVYIDKLSGQYTVSTNFADPATNACTSPVFFQLLFRCTEDDTRQPCDSGSTYMQNSIGPVLGHPRTDTQNKLAGTVQYESGSQTLRGTGTCFTRELRVGDWLYIADADTDQRYRVRITQVVSDTEAETDCGDGRGALSDIGSGHAWNGRVTMPWSRNLQPDCYISMSVGCARTLKSATPAIDGAFYLMPAVGETFFNIPAAMPFETFSPTLGRLDKLSISFRNPDNTLYDFKGANHVLLFKVVHYRPDVVFGDI